MAITETVLLDMTPGGITPIVYASQYDAGGRILAISLMDHGSPHTIPDGATVQIRGTKRDGKGFAYTGKGDGSTVYFTLERQMTACAGDVICEVRITDAGGSIIGSGNLILRVEPAGLADDTDISATEIPAIEDAAKTAAERAEAAAERAEEAAAGGAAAISPTVAMQAIDGGTRLTITDKDGAHTADIMNGKDGAKGDKGDTGAQGPQGETGASGADGISPTVTTAQTETGADITITDKAGSHTVSIANGKDGSAGAKGTDGVSPTVSFTAITGGTRLTITDANGQHSADIMNGSDGAAGAAGDPGPAGKDGKDGADGMSPSVSVAQNDTGATITITDKSGAHSVTLTNGKDGKDGANGAAGEPGPAGADGKNGKDGVSPSVSIAQTSTGATITITDASGAHTATILNGADGERGPAGADGKDGADGKAGADGVSPTVSIAQTDAGATITITDKTGEHTATILNGKNGEPGTAGAAGKDGATGPSGADGVSPTVTLTAITGGTRLTITDANGDHSTDIMNGKDGATGPAYTLTDDDKTAIVTAVLAQMTNAETEAL